MSERLRDTKLVERTRAEVEFEDGRTQSFTSEWGDTQQGRGYDGGHWGPFPEFRDRIEYQIVEAQRTWSLPLAKIRYYRESRVTETVERVIDTSKFYSERTVQS